jgi:TIR domain
VKNKAVAEAILARLEAESITCWIAPRDIVPGADWGESIINAIESSRIMILIFSQNANASPQIKREVERAVDKGVYIIPLRVDKIKPTRSLEYFISAQRMDAFSPPLERHLDNLATAVKVVIKSPLTGANGSAAPESESPMAASQISHASVSAVVPPCFPPLDSKRKVVKLILLAIAWMLVFWVSSLFLAGAIASDLNPKKPKKRDGKSGNHLVDYSS